MARWVRRATIDIAATLVLLAAVAALVWALEEQLGVPNASSVFLLAVVAAASRIGTLAGIGAAFGSFLAYDLLFTEPRFTLAVADPDEWLTLVLLLVVGIVVGRLAASQRERADDALARAREAVSLFRVTRSLATRSSTSDVLPELAEILRTEAGMDRVRIALATGAGRERTAVEATSTDATADAGASLAHLAEWTPPASHFALRRAPGDAPAAWVRVHQSTGATNRPGRGGADAYRVAIEAGDRRLGSIWAVRPHVDGPPDEPRTLLLSAAADQIGQALEQDRLGREARDLEVARRSDALKTALLESVSHDLRTPLASIRAAAGTLLDREVPLDAAAQEASAEAIDREAEHLNRLVTNLLDLSRIEAGELRANPEPFELAGLVDAAVDRLRPRLGGRTLEIDVPEALSPVLVDEVFMSQVLTNLLENAIKYTERSARIIVRAVAETGLLAGDRATARDAVLLTVEDDGPGASDDAIERLFERFYRIRRSGEPSRPGSGIGLTVVRGLVEAMGGRARASRSPLGGLAIDIRLPVAAPLPGSAAGSGPR